MARNIADIMRNEDFDNPEANATITYSFDQAASTWASKLRMRR